MSHKNRHGLSRTISQSIKREVRRRSKFGCVICRAGLYQYEHIEPEFKDAKEHDADTICCLCGSCHDAVTRGSISKQLIRKKYQEIQDAEETGFPRGPLDFHDGRSEILIGGLRYGPDARTIVRYHGEDLITVFPGGNGEPGRISAVFTDDAGEITLRLVDNEWVGSLSAWDIEVEGPRITVRKKARDISLRLRLEPPGRIVIERLDMRYRDVHILASEHTYAVGRQLPGSDKDFLWLHVHIELVGSINGVLEVINFISPEAAQRKIGTASRRISGNVTQMRSTDGKSLFGSIDGFISVPVGVNVGRGVNDFRLFGAASGIRSLKDLRNVFWSNPDLLPGFIGLGRLPKG